MSLSDPSRAERRGTEPRGRWTVSFKGDDDAGRDPGRQMDALQKPRTHVIGRATKKKILNSSRLCRCSRIIDQLRA